MKFQEMENILIKFGATSKNKSIQSRLFRKEVNKKSVNSSLKTCKKSQKINGGQWRDEDVNGNKRDDLWHWWLKGR